MKAVILCGGYATRLYPLTLDKPKALLPIKGRPILDHIVGNIPTSIEDITVVSNGRFYNDFLNWSRNYAERVHVINDGSNGNETRLGGIGDLELAIRERKID